MADSVHIPLGLLRDRLDTLDKNKLIIVYCSIGVRSYNAARILMQRGFKNVKVYPGGTSFFKAVYYDRKGQERAEIMKTETPESVSVDMEIKAKYVP